jgi:hypothetical protein
MRQFPMGLPLSVLTWSITQAAGPQHSINDTGVKVPIADNVSMDDAVDSVTLRANTLKPKLVAHLPTSCPQGRDQRWPLTP